MPLQISDERVYVGAYGFCQDGAGRLLLARLRNDEGPDAGKWTLPGGGVLWGEHPDQAVVREMEEETGLLDLEPGQVLSIYSHTYLRTPTNPLPPLHHIGIIYKLVPDTLSIQNEQEGSTDLCQWLEEDQARALPLTQLGELGVELAWGRSKV